MLLCDGAKDLGIWSGQGSSLDKDKAEVEGVESVESVESVERVWSCKLIFKSETVERAYR